MSKQRALNFAGVQPKIPEGYDIYLDVFFNLSSERHNGEGYIGSIPTTKILEYANWLGIEKINDFIEVIARMDKAYVDAISQQIQRQMKQASKGK